MIETNQTQRCEKCGTELEPRTRFCDTCGHPVATKAQSPQTSPPALNKSSPVIEDIKIAMQSGDREEAVRNSDRLLLSDDPLSVQFAYQSLKQLSRDDSRVVSEAAAQIIAAYEARIKGTGATIPTGKVVPAKTSKAWLWGIAALGGLAVLGIALFTVLLLTKNLFNQKQQEQSIQQAAILKATMQAQEFVLPTQELSQPSETQGKPNVGIKVIKIASQSPLSGGMSAVGSDIKNGAQLALEQFGKPLGDMGFKVELAPFDDQGNPDVGVANANQIAADPAILCIVGHYNSGVQIPSSEVYHTSGLANVSPANTNPKVTDRGYLEVNRILGRDDVQGKAGAQFAKSKGITTAYVIHDKTVYGQGLAELFKAEAETIGIKVLGFEGTEETANFDALLSPFIAAKPEVLFFGGMYDQANVLFKQAREKGYMGMFISDDGYDYSESVKIGGEALLDGAGTFYVTVAGPASIYPDAAKFTADFKEKFKADPQPFAAQSYDAMAICLKAIENAAKANGGILPTSGQVAKAVREIVDYKGITGVISFNNNGDLNVAKYYIIQVISADPAKWGQNPVVATFDIVPPP